MRLFSPLKISAVIAFGASSANAWEHQMARGLDLYTIPNASVGVSLVCDPNTVYGSSESAVLVQIGTDPYETKDLVFHFADEISVQARLEKGRIAKIGTEAVVWQTLIDGFREFETVTIKDGDTRHPVNLGEPTTFSCI